MRQYEEGPREQMIIITAKNVLEPKNLLKLYQLNEDIKRFTVELENGTTLSWPDVCYKIPMPPNTPLGGDTEDSKNSAEENESREKRDLFSNSAYTNLSHPFNPSVDLSPKLFCPLFNSLPFGCYQKNILDIWENDLKVIEELTLDDVINDLVDSDYESILSGIQRDDQGRIISAESAISTWFVYIKFANIDTDRIGNSIGMESWVTEDIILWEGGFLETVAEVKAKLDDGDFTIDYMAGRSFGDIASASLFPHPLQLMSGAIAMLIYMQIMISKFNWIEFRLRLNILGLQCVVLAIGFSFGITSMFHFSYSVIESSLPFLLMGLSVDDIFVIMACLRHVNRMHPGEPVPIRIGHALKHAGVSITITSVTDFAAFMVGSFSSAPAIRVFCITAMVAVAATYFSVCTFFVALLALDEKRISEKRNGLISCIVHKDAKDLVYNEDNSWPYKCFKYIYKEIILTKPGKVKLKFHRIFKKKMFNSYSV